MCEDLVASPPDMSLRDLIRTSWPTGPNLPACLCATALAGLECFWPGRSISRYQGPTDKFPWKRSPAMVNVVLLAPEDDENRRDVNKDPIQAISEQTGWMLAVRDRRDKHAFGRLFDFFAPRLKGMILRSGASAAEAEDIVQDVMLAVWHRADSFDPHRAQVSSWIYQIARNRQIDILRKTRRPVPEELKSDEAPEIDPLQVIALEQETKQLRAALDALSEDQRAMIEKAYLGELSHSEIQANTGLPLGTIKSRIRLALEKLRHELRGTRQP